LEIKIQTRLTQKLKLMNDQNRPTLLLPHIYCLKIYVHALYCIIVYWQMSILTRKLKSFSVIPGVSYYIMMTKIVLQLLF